VSQGGRENVDTKRFTCTASAAIHPLYTGLVILQVLALVLVHVLGNAAGGRDRTPVALWADKYVPRAGDITRVATATRHTPSATSFFYEGG
jgi:hypothetical protein